jgi:ABC-type lipopolysaccharide export system ATPase subunit
MPIEEAIFFLSEAKLGLGDYLKRRESIFKNMTLKEIIAEVKEFEREGS